MIYKVGMITPVRESNGGRTLHGFNLIGINGRPLVTFNYETEEEAAATREQMRQAVARERRRLSLTRRSLPPTSPSCRRYCPSFVPLTALAH